MGLSQEDLAAIVERSSTLSERMSGGFQFVAPANSKQLDDRWERWRKAVRWRGQAPDTLERRLAWDGWDPEKARQALGPVRLADPREVPPWARLLADIVERVDSEGDAIPSPAEKSFVDPQSPAPFEEVFAPIVRFARDRLSSRSQLYRELLEAPARVELERSLLSRLVELAAPVLELRFSAQRAARGTELDWLGGGGAQGARAHYDAFVQEMLGGGLQKVFLNYSVLARLVATVVEQWCDANAEFLARLESDAMAIRDAFGAGNELGPVERLRASLSDPHHDGRTAIGIRFSSGPRVVYKTKNLGLDVAFRSFVEWLNEQGLDPPLQTPFALARDEYGWVEFVEPAPCRDQDELRRYYERAGALVCLGYVLGGADFHYENLIASGEHPILVDLEALMTPWWDAITASVERSSAEALASQRLWDSVLRTGLLPRWDSEQPGEALEVSGLGDLDGRRTWGESLVWQQVNTDQMRRELSDTEIEPLDNLPTLEGEPAAVERHVEDLLRGFCETYNLFAQHRDEITAKGGPLEKFRNQRTRPVLRPTRLYGSLLKMSLQRPYLREGVERSLELEAFTKTSMFDEARPPYWPLYAAEMHALERLDIPCFSASTTDTYIETPGMVPIEGFFAQSGFQRTLATLKRLDDVDLKQQIAYIRALFLPTEQDSPSALAGAVHAAESAEIAQLTPQAALDHAVRIAAEIESQAIVAGDEASWIGLTFMQQAQRYQPARLEWNFYDGVPGVALFLAALSSETGDSRWRDLSLAALAPFRGRLSHPAARARTAARSSLGGATGLGSIVYVLALASRFLDVPSLLDDAAAAANLITPEAVAADRALDVVGGSAGAILALLALHASAPNCDLVEQARACAAHLLEHRDTTAGGYRAWRSPQGPHLTGFSHGAAGIAMSLLRLYSVCGDRELLDAAREAIEWETRVFDSSAGNWPDFREGLSPDHEFATSWCHGAPGIALARLGGLAALDDSRIRRDIDAGTAATLGCSIPDDVDLLCCGNMGRADVLLTLGRALGRQDLVTAARQRAASVIGRWKDSGTFTFFANLPSDGSVPGFFQGSTGIGYQLLRVARPERYPSVLLWE